jgi:hypothetical protein
MDLFLHCMLCGSEWRSETRVYPEEVKTVIQTDPGEEETKDAKEAKEEKEPGERECLTTER